ncbi:hypothetical protein ACLOJK_003325 [Asimina triloba]
MSRRTETRYEMPPATERATSSLPTLDDKIRGYRQMQRTRHLTNQRFRRIFSRNYRNTIERQLDPNAELMLSRQRRANLVPAEVLYSHNNGEPHNRVYQHYEEVRAHVVDRQHDMRFIEETSYQTLTREGMQHMHIGMMMLRIHMLHRTDTGVSAMVVFRDTRWSDDRQVIGSMTLDRTRGAQLVYIIPNLMLSIHDFYNHIQVSVQTRGYGTGWVSGESNMIITRSLVARLTNTSVTSFGYQIQDVTDYLASNGVACIPGERWEITNRVGEWQLRPSAILPPPQVPTGARLRLRDNGNISLRFTDFEEQRIPQGETDADVGRPEEHPDTVHYALAGRFEEETEENGWYVHAERNNFQFRVRMDAPASASRRIEDIIPTGWEDDERPPSPPKKPADEILAMYPRRSSSNKQICAAGSFSKGKTSPFDEFDIRSNSSLVKSWLSQLFDELSEPDSDRPVYNDTTSSSSEEEQRVIYDTDSEADFPTEDHAYAGVGNKAPQEQEDEPMLAYPSKIQKAKTLLDTLKRKMKVQMQTALAGEGSSMTYEGSSGFVPPNPTTGPVGYPPADDNIRGRNYTIPLMDNWYGGRRPQRYGRPPAPWTLPSAQPCRDAIATWENITLNLIRDKNFDSFQDKADYIENLLGQREKEAWISWRMAYETEYKQIVEVGDEPRNITSAIKRVLGIHDPYTGNVHAQNQAYADLERLQCSKIEDVMPFLNSYFQLAARSGRMWQGPELSDKLFRKLPPEIGPAIEKEYKEKYPGLNIGVNAQIQFISEYLMNLCKQASLQRKLKNLNFCRNMPIPGYYEPSRQKKYGLRKASKYKGKPHDTHVKVIKNKYKHTEGRKCKCYLCGIEGHYARECPRKHVKPQWAAFFDGAGLDDNWDVVSVEPGEPDDDEICSISEGEAQNDMSELAAFKAQLRYPVEAQYTNPAHQQQWSLALIQVEIKIGESSQQWRAKYPLPEKKQTCQDTWDDKTNVPPEDRWFNLCKEATPVGRRVTCTTCFLNLCSFCAVTDFGIHIVKDSTESRAKWKFTDRDTLISKLYEHNAFLLKQVKGLQEELATAKAKIKDLKEQLFSADLIDFSNSEVANLEDISRWTKEIPLKGGEGETS